MREHLWQKLRSLFGGSGRTGRQVGGAGSGSVQRRTWTGVWRSYGGPGCSCGLVLLQALLCVSCVRRPGKQSASAALCSPDPSAAEATGAVRWTVAAWGFTEGSAFTSTSSSPPPPPPQKGLLLRESAGEKHAAPQFILDTLATKEII